MHEDPGWTNYRKLNQYVTFNVTDNLVQGENVVGADLEHEKSKVNGEGFLNHGLGDWGNPRNELVRENIETAFLYADTVSLAKFAEILGKTEAAKWDFPM